MRHLVVVSLFLLGAATAHGQLTIPQNPMWDPIADEVYLQEVSALVPTERPLVGVAVYNGTTYAADAAGLWKLDGTSLASVPFEGEAITRLKTVGDALWISSKDGVWKLDATGMTKVTDKLAADFCLHNGKCVFVSGRGVYAVEESGPVALAEEAGSELLGVASYSGTLYVHNGRHVGLLERGEVRFEEIADWGKFEGGCSIRDLLSFGSRLVVATDEGLNELRGMTWYKVRGADGLCYEDTTCLTPGFARDMWIGTTRGAIRNVNDEYQYFGQPRWLPHDKVNAIACSRDTVYFATDGGLGVIMYEPYTLAKKAAYYERWLDEWGQKRLGFVHGLFFIDGEWLREVSDNDVGYSSHYFAAKCFEYAVTGSPEARAAALDMMKSMKWSEEISSIEGFPARSIYAVGESCVKAGHGSGGLPAEWHPTADGLWEWKGDTSSDETDAHIYATSIFLKLVANEDEREWATEHLDRLVKHIVDNGFMLRDVDGKPTRWARWDPEYLQTPYGYYARGLNSLEAFNYVTTAFHFTHDDRFQSAKQQLCEWNYFKDILRQKLAFHPGEITPFDDRLAFYSYFSLIPYETDPELKSLWLRSLERSWEIKRIDGVPWFNFVYGALTGNDCELGRALAHLREWPLDLRRYNYTNSHRADLDTPKGYRAYAERSKPLSPRETEPNRWDGDFMQLDGGGGGKVVADAGGWLNAYWMGRYYGMISAPKTTDPELVSVPARGLQLGAKPYIGPPRPKLRHEQ